MQRKSKCRRLDSDVYVGRLRIEDIAKIIAKNQDFKAVVDASHPFAEEASKNALSGCQEAKFHIFGMSVNHKRFIQLVSQWLKDYEEAAEVAARKKGVIMLTTGSKTLRHFHKGRLHRSTKYTSYRSDAATNGQYGKMRKAWFSTKRYCGDTRTLYKRV